MDTTTFDGDNFPCQCHLSQYAYTDDLCPECAERAGDGPEMRMAEGTSDEEPEYYERPDSDGFADACGMMTQDDWDADNDWLASAGWGEM